MASVSSGLRGRAADVAYDAFYSGAIGGSAVALYFLAVDLLNGQPLFTPSLMGSVLFEGASAAAVSGVRLDMVAYYSVVHFVAFGALGGAISVSVHEVELRARHPLLVLIGLFALFELGFFAVASLLLPGVVERLGPWQVAAANFAAAAAIAVFLMISHQPQAWRRLKHAVHAG
jgi:hypothetical protein